MAQNTTRIQIQSVINFLQELGYTYFQMTVSFVNQENVSLFIKQ